MKRILALLLAFTLLFAAGCGNSSVNNTPPDDAQVEDNQTPGTNDTTPPADDSGASDEGTTDETPDDTPIVNSDYNPTVTGFKTGDTIADFTITTFDKKEVTLSSVLAEKDAVLINIFATWCGPCKSEFPFMEESYQQFKDRVEVIALSGDSTDTNEMIRQLATSLGVTFPMGQDTAGISRGFKVNAFPTTILIDRFGTIVYTHIGSFPDAQSFINLYDFLVSDEYTESVVLKEIPPAMPHIDQLSGEELSAAMGDAGLVFENVAGQYTWPMALAEIDGRSTLVSTNKDKNQGFCAVQTTVTAAAGEVFAFDLKLSSEATFDYFTMKVNGEIVKVFSGELDWTGYAYQFPADGEYTIELAYLKDDYTGVGEDTLWLDNARILSGDEAAAALAANPSYPTADETTFRITNKDITEVFFEDPYGIVYKIFGCPYQAYIVNALEVNCEFTIAGDVDPEATICYDNHDLRYCLTSLVSGKGYALTCAVDSLETTGKGFTYVVLDPDVMKDGDELPIVFFANVEGLEKFAKTFAAGGWCKADELESAPWYKAEEEEPQGDVTYTLRCEDENGERIAGVTLQVCNDSTCSVYVTDENGECVLTLPADNYEIHILKAPEGYTFDSEAIVEAPAAGGEFIFNLKRA